MSLNDTPSGERTHIAFFGLRNAGKSSLVNAVTGQDLAVVSDVKGTTTDPVRKAMELLPLGGELRVKRALQVLANCDVAVLVHDASQEFAQAERDLIGVFESRKLPYVIAHNKADLLTLRNDSTALYVSALTGENVNALKERIASLAKHTASERRLIGDLLTQGGIVILVVPIDKAAPKGIWSVRKTSWLMFWTHSLISPES